MSEPSTIPASLIRQITDAAGVRWEEVASILIEPWQVIIETRPLGPAGPAKSITIHGIEVGS